MSKDKRTLHIGDIVYLKSGSRRMTVVGTGYIPGEVKLGWSDYNTKEYHTADIHPDALLTKEEYQRKGSRF